MKHRLLFCGILVLALSMLLGGIAFAEEAVTVQQNQYVGSGTCEGCHYDVFEGWSETTHGMAIRDAQDPANLMVDPLSVGAIDESLVEKYFYARYVYTTAGGGQRFIWRNMTDGEYYWLPLTYDPKAGWTGDPTAALSGWSVGGHVCAGCHTTGYDATSGSWAEVSITCEACHGPGEAHVKSGGDPTLINRVNDPESCSTCHESYAQQITWELSGHAEALPGLKSSGHANDACAECHSSDAMFEGATLASAQKSITCSMCHDLHSGEEEAMLTDDSIALCADCHNGELEGTAFEAGSSVHHPMKEMYTGVGAVGVSGTSDFHYVLGVTCQDCHAVEVNEINGVSLGHSAGTDHRFEAVLPGDAEAQGLPEDSCTSCHAHSDSSREVRQNYIDFWQGQTSALLAEVGDLLAEAKPYYSKASASLKLKYDTAYTDHSMVEADGSMGVHNFEYTMRMLLHSKGLLEEFLNEVK